MNQIETILVYATNILSIYNREACVTIYVNIRDCTGNSDKNKKKKWHLQKDICRSQKEIQLLCAS